MKAPGKFIQWAIVSAIFAVGFYGFLMVCDEDLFCQMTDRQFLFEKIMGLAIIAACVLFGKYLYRKGILPIMDFKNKD